ncbi:MAG: aminoacetone oxidase family FAD-binding enzyme, partial [Saprospiraceae bacterium]|nr:aminoacetone oxidase family FAD-binding enzyme [Saprospiraceae bacterium]
MQEKLKVAVIGGGAAGFFSAINVSSNYPEASVTLFEKSTKLLAKVAISGGGRCNITNGSSSIKELSSAYPRGRKFMKKLLTQFTTSDIRNWFDQKGVASKVESDNRVFPISDNSKSVVDCLIREARSSGVDIQMRQPVTAISQSNGKIKLSIKDTFQMVDKVIIATGGSPSERGFKWLESLGHQIVKPVPSLFTFNMPKNPVTRLMGVSVPNAIARIQGTKLESEGPLL